MRKRGLLLILAGVGSNFFPQMASAHCPLCTLGAGAAALAATWLGVQSMAVAVFLGAFAVALGLWTNRLLLRQFVPFQGLILGAISFLLTILPLQPLFYDYASVYLNWGGAYGSMLNRTYILDRFLVGAVIGATLLILAPGVSRFLSKKIKRHIPFQGILISFLMLIFAALVIQLSL